MFLDTNSRAIRNLFINLHKLCRRQVLRCATHLRIAILNWRRGLSPIGLASVTHGMVEWADAVIGEATYASTGLGIELQIATQKATPIILCFQRKEENRVAEAEYLNPDNTHHHLQIGEGYVTLMALGLPTIFKVVGYATEDEAVQSILHATTLITIQQYNRTQSSQSTGDLGRV